MSCSGKKRKYKLIFLAMLGVLLVEIILCTALGAADISFSSAVKSVLVKIPLIKDLIDPGTINESHVVIINSIRLPRVILAACIGSALSVSGVSYQSMFKNPLADPYIIGSSSGGALGAAVAIVLKSTLNIPGFSIISVFAFGGALAAAYIVYMLGKIGGRLSITAIILSGIALNSLLSAILSLVLLFNREQMNQIIMWTMGGLQNSSWEQIAIVLPGIIIGMLVIYFCSRDLNILLLGEESAQHLGVNTGMMKKIILFTGAFLTGLSVSVSGIIGFIGIFIPHTARLLLGPDNRIIIPFSALWGAIFLIAADGLARILISPGEIPVGVLTAVVGGPFFIYLLIKSKKKLA